MLHRPLLIAALAIASASVVPASAQSDAEVENALTPAHHNCMNRAGGVTANMLDCDGTEHALQDRLLNASYQRVMARLTRQQANILRASQRTWLRAREHQCQMAMGEDAGGSLGTIIYSSCFLRQTTQRRLWLGRYHG